MTIALLRDNLHEIGSAEGKNSDLVANFCGTRVYYKGSGWGRLWKWFYRIASIFIGTQLEQDKLDAAITKTCKIFEKEQQLIAAEQKKFNALLADILKNIDVPRSELYDASVKIVRWHDAVDPFIKKCRDYSAIKLKKEVDWRHPDGCEDAVSILNLERITGEQLPYGALTRLAIGANLYSEEKKALAKWTKKLNKADVGSFHQALRGLVNILSDPKADLNRLLYTLAKDHAKCRSILLQEDPAHMQSFLPGDRVDKYTIEKALSKHVYTLVNEPDIILRTGINAAILGIQMHAWKTDAECVRTADWYEVDRDGRYAIQERLHRCIADINWKSDGISNIHKDDRNSAFAIAGRIAWLRKQALSASCLDPKKLMFSKREMLKSTIVIVGSPASIAELERFAWECANKNLSVFRYLITASGIRQDPSCRFFDALFERALTSDEEIDVDEFGSRTIYGVKPASLIDAGKKMVEKVRRRKKKRSHELIRQAHKKSLAMTFIV